MTTVFNENGAKSIYFTLTEDFVNKYKWKQPNWGPIGYVTYKRTYARTMSNGKSEEYWNTIQRVVEGIFTIQKRYCYINKLPWNQSKAQKSAQRMFELMWDFKFTPPGRGLWMMGTEAMYDKGSAALMNCFSGDTEFYTDKGTVRFEDVVGNTVNVLTKDREFKPAEVKSFGKQKLQRTVFKPVGLRSNHRIDYEVTKDHRWILSNGEETTSLKVGDRVRSTVKPYDFHTDIQEKEYKNGIVHGLMFGDGWKHTYYPHRFMIRLCGEKNSAENIKILTEHPGFISSTNPPSCDGDSVVTIITEDIDMKQLPYDTSIEYQIGFVDGWLKADSWLTPSGSTSLNTQNSEAAEWFIKNANILNYNITGHTLDERETNYGKRKNPLHRILLTKEDVEFVVESIIDEGKIEEVYCVVEPETHTFTLAGGLPTGNCAFASTENINIDFAQPFIFMMDMSMLGVGVGSDTRGAGKITIKQPKFDEEVHVVPDTREGWVDLLKRLLNAFVGKDTLPKSVDYSLVRPAGEIIKGFGGVASGPGPLIEMYESIENLLNLRIGQKITTTDIVDIHNLIGRCVVSGNIRRSAQIMFGDYDDQAFLDLKNPDVSKEELMHHRWASNNSVFVKPGDDYSKVAELTAKNGEPGYLWLDNSKQYSRMNGIVDNKDYRVMGTNPSMPAGTLVCTTKGIYPIEKLEGQKFYVKSIDGSISTAECFKSKNDKELIEIEFNKGISVKCTEEHRWPIYKAQKSEGTLIKTYAKDLVVGDLIPLSRNEPPRITDGNNDLTIDDGFFLGYLLGDGWISTRKSENNVGEKVLGFTFGKDSLHLSDKILNTLNEFGSKCNVTINDKGYGNIQTSNQSVIKKIEETYGWCGKDKIPTSVWTSNDRFIHGFIDGLLSSDGCVSKNTIILVTSRKNLAKEFTKLISFFGIKSSILETTTTGNFPNKKDYDKTYTVYRIKFSGTQFLMSGLTISHKEKQNIKKGSYIQKSNTIKNIKRIPNEDVWDITVYDDTHVFPCEYVYTGNCGEQPLENMEMCNLVETYPGKHDTLAEWIETLKYAYLYAKTVTLLPSHNEISNAVMMRNRRIGCSMSGITQAFTKFGRRAMLEASDKGYNKIQDWDKKYSDWLCIPRSIKVTSIKPSGTVSLLGGVTPGVHYPVSEYYIRNIRFQEGTPLLDKLRESGYKVEKDSYSLNTWVVSFPVKEEFFDRAVTEVSIWEQLENAAQIQEYWADNQVSVTVSFKPEEAEQIKYALEMYESRLKSVSFLPHKEHGYVQAPYIPITKEEYEKMNKEISDVRVKDNVHDQVEKFCDGDTCLVEIKK